MNKNDQEILEEMDLSHLNAKTILEDFAALKRAMKDIAKNRKTWKAYKKAAKEGKISAEQLESARAVLSEATAESFEIAFDRGFAIGQGNLCDHPLRAGINARELIS